MRREAASSAGSRRAAQPRFQVLPVGLGSWGVYDHGKRRWAVAYTGRGAQQAAVGRHREPAGAR